MTETPIVPDSQHRGLVASLPPRLRDYALLARFDRPIGTWLLFWPCAWGVALAGGLPRDVYLILLMGLGALVMRGAGCVYNDIVDRDLDARVERTRARPLASGRVSVRAAWNWLFALSMVGLVVLVQLLPLAQFVALASLALVAAYPFMKRITWWPQAWLGLTFNWGALVGYTAVSEAVRIDTLLLYAGGVFWTLGYDTIYALQDIEDDALAGIKSSARRLGAGLGRGVAVFYTLALACWAAALALAGPLAGAVLLLPAALHLGWQVARLKGADGATALRLFRSNSWTGLLLFAAFAGAGWL